jgi:hypothetical protein
MDEDVLYSRREFMGFSAMGALGAVAQQTLEESPPLAREPTVTLQDPPARPSAPAVINFAADDFTTRGATFLHLRWPVPNRRWPIPNRAERYEVRFVRDGTEEIKPAATNEGRFDALLPNQNYNISVRALNSAGASDWSPPLAVCTRPAKPLSPTQGYNEMVQVNTDMLLLWNLSASGLPAGAVIRLDKRREGGPVTVLTQSTDVQGSFVDGDYTIGDHYALSININNPLAPGGVNRSERSDEIRPLKMVFAELRLPGEQEAKQTSINYLRDYYG